MRYQSLIRETPDFPKPGVIFKDILPVFADPTALQSTLEEFANIFDLRDVDTFAGIESRGFILAMGLAVKTRKAFIPIRKAGKLPGATFKKSYSLEYGEATLEIAKSAPKKLVIVDDLLATGGTLAAAIHLCELAGHTIQDVGVMINLQFLNQLKFNNQTIKSLLSYS